MHIKSSQTILTVQNRYLMNFTVTSKSTTDIQTIVHVMVKKHDIGITKRLSTIKTFQKRPQRNKSNVATKVYEQWFTV